MTGDFDKTARDRQLEVLDVLLHIVRSNAESCQSLLISTTALQVQVEALMRAEARDERLAIELAELKVELKSRPTVRQLLSAIVSAAGLTGLVVFGILQVMS